VRESKMIIEKKNEEIKRDNIFYNCKPNHWGEQNCCKYKAKKSITTDTTKENSWPQYFSLYRI